MRKIPYTQSRDGLRQIVGPDALTRIARAIWWGKYGRVGNQKFASLTEAGINGRYAYVHLGGDCAEQRFNTWLPLPGGEFEVQLTIPRADYPGYIFVRRHEEGE